MILLLTIYQIILALVFHFLDLTTGLIGAIKNGLLESAKMRDGMFKKVGFIFCYVLAIILDKYGYILGFTFEVKILSVIVTYAVTTELVSIAENIHKINQDILPERLLKLFHIKDEKG